MTDFYDPTVNLNPDLQSEENRLVNKALTKFPVPHFSGLKLKADIKLGNLTLNTIDDDNVVWVCTDIEGWWNFPDPEVPDLIRGWGDGSYDARGRWAARLVTLKGVFLTQDPSQVPAARAKLIEAANLVYKGGWLIVNEDGHTDPSSFIFPANPSNGDSYIPEGSSITWKYNSVTETWVPNGKGSFVRLSGRPEIATVSPRGRTEFSIGLKAADPIKYEFEPIVATVTNAQASAPSSGYVTYTTSTAHGFNAGNYVTIAGSSIEGYNGTFLITEVLSSTTFVVANKTTGTETWSNGSATVYEEGYKTATLSPSSSSITINNTGNTSVPIVIELSKNFTVSNPASPPTITNARNDQVMKIIEGTAADNQLEIDTYNREVLDVEYDGTDIVNVENGRAKVAVLSDWIYLEPGANAFTITNFPAGSICTIYYRSGWIG